MKTFPLLGLTVVLTLGCAFLSPSVAMAGPKNLAAAAPGKTQQITSPEQVPDGLAKSDWQSIRATYEAGKHAFQPTATGWQARNPGQQWTTTFDGRGFLAQPQEGAWQWGLELRGYGWGGTQSTIDGTPAVKAEGQRLSYQWDATVQEWWVNDARGLEHGFTVAARPVDGTDGTNRTDDSHLTLLLGTRGTLRPAVAVDAQGVLFQDATGATVLNYTGLKVWDADGKVLPSRFEAAGEKEVRLIVEEAGARYPLTIDPIAQQAYFKASNTGVYAYFGYSVAVSGDTVVIGAPYEASSTPGVNGTPNIDLGGAGAAYVFVRTAGVWAQQAYLKASNPGLFDNFGRSVAISGDTIVVGSYAEDSSTAGVNATPNEGALNAGAAYVFIRTAGVWTQQAFLKASNPGADDAFGSSVSMSGDTVAIGAPHESSGTTGVNSTPNESSPNAGAVYVFMRQAGVWTEQAYLKASNTASENYFGTAVAVSGDTVVVGSMSDNAGAPGTGSAAYVFVRAAGSWSQQALLKSGNTGYNDGFGYSVAVWQDTVVVGAPSESSNATGVNSVPSGSLPYSGAAYIFERNAGLWTQQAYLKASNPDIVDLFGTSVTVSDNLVAVGSLNEGSNSTGVNSAPNESAAYAGAVYTFLRVAGQWLRDSYLKAGNAGMYHAFGVSVAADGGMLIVGANAESSSTTGVNSTPNTNAAGAGAAYVFTGFGELAPEITVEQPAGTQLVDGGSRSFGAVVIGETISRTFTIRNTGSAVLTGLEITMDGAEVGDFSVTAFPTAPVGLSGSTTFTVQFAPGGAGPRTATLHIASNDGDESPFDLTLTGTGSATPAPTVLLIWDVMNTHTAALNAALENAGNMVTFSETDETGYDGTNPSPAGFTAVIHLNGIAYNTPMPTAGQIALTNYVNGGGIYIGHEWNAYEVANTPNLRELVLFDYTGEGSANLTYTAVTAQAGHALLAGLPSSFTFNTGFTSCSLHTFATNPSTVLMTDNNDHPAVAVRSYGGGKVVNFSHSGNYQGRGALSDVNIQRLYLNACTLPTNEPEIAVEQPAGTNLTSGAVTLDFGTRPAGSTSAAKTFTIRNTGLSNLTVSAPALAGGNTNDFIVNTTGTLATFPPGQQTTFTVAFNPTGAGTRTTTLRIGSDDADENPFDITLTGKGLVTTQDNDGDGLNDVAEFNLSALGFDYAVAQPALVAALNSGANTAGFYDAMQYEAYRIAGRNDVTGAPNTYNLYTLVQVQALNVDVPLLQRNAATGKFALKIGLKKTANLALPFADFPMNGAGSDAFINAAGNLEFEFSVPGDAAFFRLEAR